MKFKILGILNVTPDSFSDGGRFTNPQSALQQAQKLISDGADWIDVGAESTRPGAETLSTQEEWDRLEPILNTLKALPLSVDTAKPEIMEKCLKYGVKVINCTDGVIQDEPILKKLAQHRCHYIAMHRHGSSKDMQQNPLTADQIIPTVEKFYRNSWQKLLTAGFEAHNIWLDPGYGFGKDIAAQTKLMAYTKYFSEKYQTVVGISRKSWLGTVLDLKNPLDRDNSSRMLETGLIFSGAKMVRSHDVRVLSSIRSMI